MKTNLFASSDYFESWNFISRCPSSLALVLPVLFKGIKQTNNHNCKTFCCIIQLRNVQAT